MGLEFGCEGLLEELIDFPGQRFCILSEVEIDPDGAYIGQHRSVARIKSPPRLLEQAFRIAVDQHPGLGAQIIEVDVVFDGQAIAAESAQRLDHGHIGGLCIPPQRQRNMCRCRRLAAGDLIDHLPDEQPPALDLGDKIGQRMRQRLVSADRHAEGMALAGIGGGEPHCFAGKAAECCGGEQFPFLKRRGEGAGRLLARCKDREAGSREIDFADAVGGERFLRPAVRGDERCQHNIIAAPGHDDIGMRAAS